MIKQDYREHLRQMVIKRQELQDISMSLAQEFLACGIDNISNGNPKKMAYQMLSQGIGLALEARCEIVKMAAENIKQEEL